MNKHFVWLDCDTGTDDGAAILCANRLPELEIVAISAVMGNAAQEDTFLNAHRLNRLMGTAYPVYAGAEKPWLVPYEIASTFHGVGGLGGLKLPLPEPLPRTEEKAWEALSKTARKFDGDLELIATGPLTNVATALEYDPELPKYLKRIVLMGGAAVGGNITPAAEFNIYTDPHAAKAVFASGIPLTMVGLDVTMNAYFTAGELEALGDSGHPMGAFFRDLMQTPLKAQRVPDRVPIHDGAAVLFAARPELFSGKMAGVQVETRGRLTRGKTVTDLDSDKKFGMQNAFVVLTVDRPAFVKTVSDLILSY